MATLKLLRNTVQRWESALAPDSMSTRRKVSPTPILLSSSTDLRRKTAEIITLLYETAQSNATDDDHEPTLGPTPGVVSKLQGSLKELVFKEDNSRPGGGIFVVSKKRFALGDLPETAVMAAADKESVASSASQDGGERTPIHSSHSESVTSKVEPDENTDQNVLDVWGSALGIPSVPATNDGVPYLFPSRTLDAQLQHQMSQAVAYGNHNYMHQNPHTVEPCAHTQGAI